MPVVKSLIHAASEVPVTFETAIKIGDIKKLQVRALTFISGVIYTARNKAHVKIHQNRTHLPFNLEGACIYHSGPIIIQSKEKYRVVTADPTTSARMNEYIPDIIKVGVRAIIGKGGLSDQAVEVMKEQGRTQPSQVGVEL